MAPHTGFNHDSIENKTLKDKDKEALFGVAYKQTTYPLTNIYLPLFIFLSLPLIMLADLLSEELIVPFLFWLL